MVKISIEETLKLILKSPRIVDDSELPYSEQMRIINAILDRKVDEDWAAFLERWPEMRHYYE